jgi:hypothetical protein
MVPSDLDPWNIIRRSTLVSDPNNPWPWLRITDLIRIMIVSRMMEEDDVPGPDSITKSGCLTASRELQIGILCVHGRVTDDGLDNI